MSRGLYALVDAWIARHARPVPEALAAVAGRAPATVITGASRGIGLVLARRFAEAGSDIVLIARNRDALADAAAGIAREHKVRALPLALDITDAGAPQAIDAALAAQGLYADCLVNNAGVGLSGAFHADDAAAIDRLLVLNIAAATRLMHHALGPMRARGRGAILNVASLGGLVPGPYQAAYYASKAYLISLTEAVAYEIGGEGVRIAVVAPGPVATGFHDAMGAGSALYRQIVPAATPESVARSAYRGLMLGRRVIVPGVLGTLSQLAVKVLPHALTVPMVAALLRPDPAAATASAPRPADNRDG